MQVSEWKAYDRLDPVGKWRDELSIASLSSLIVNLARQILRDPKKGKVEFVTPNDFMMDWGNIKEDGQPEPKKQSQEEMANVLRAIASVQGTRDKIEKK